MFIPWDQRRVGISLGSGALLKELLLLERLESPLETVQPPAWRLSL